MYAAVPAPSSRYHVAGLAALPGGVDVAIGLARSVGDGELLRCRLDHHRLGSTRKSSSPACPATDARRMQERRAGTAVRCASSRRTTWRPRQARPSAEAESRAARPESMRVHLEEGARRKSSRGASPRARVADPARRDVLRPARPSIGRAAEKRSQGARLGASSAAKISAPRRRGLAEWSLDRPWLVRRGLRPLWLDAWQASRRHPALLRAVTEQMRADLERLEALIRGGSDRGELRVADATGAALRDHGAGRRHARPGRRPQPPSTTRPSRTCCSTRPRSRSASREARSAGRSPPRRTQCAAGGTFWFSRNTFSGSYWRLTSASRSQVEPG